MRIADTRLLVCPRSGGPLAWEGTNLELTLADGILRAADGGSWPVVDGIARLYRDEDLRGTDRLIRHIHDQLPPGHRPLARLGLPLLQGGGTEAALLRTTLHHLRLDALRPPAGRPARLLEVGVGTGVHLPLVRAALGATPHEYWGVDLSEGLLRRCRQRFVNPAMDQPPRLLLADAHRLPFPADTFDRVFHVGGLGRFDDPARVLAELLRVLVPGGRVAVIGKRLDPREEQAPLIQAAYRLLTVHEPEVAVAPPPGAVDVAEEQVSRFFYALTYGKPA